MFLDVPLREYKVFFVFLQLKFPIFSEIFFLYLTLTESSFCVKIEGMLFRIPFSVFVFS